MVDAHSDRQVAATLLVLDAVDDADADADVADVRADMG